MVPGKDLGNTRGERLCVSLFCILLMSILSFRNLIASISKSSTP